MLQLIAILVILYWIISKLPEDWQGFAFLGAVILFIVFMCHEDRKNAEAWYNRRDYWLHYDRKKHRHKWD